jgi:hypothetical protein
VIFGTSYCAEGNQPAVEHSIIGSPRRKPNFIEGIAKKMTKPAGKKNP